MTAENAERVLELFAEARACEPEQRANFLSHACAGNDAVRAEIESLLSGEAPMPAFLAQPAFERGMEVLGDVEAASELKAGDLLGDCRVISLLGVGGMGEVYLADDLALGRRVALKLIQRGRGGTLLSHFRHERRVLAGLTHPNIARLYGGAVTPEGRAYLVMEYVEGERLDRYCETREIPLTERLTLFRKICAALTYAHQSLVVHRDLKPANIRVTLEGEPKLLDFGIAKLLDPEGTPGMEPTVTMSGALTPEYASPEQLRGEAITTASDVYSLGVVLYELLCGQRPYQLKGRRPDELAHAICEEQPPRPSTVAGRGLTASRIGPATTVTTSPATVGGETPARLRRRLEGDLDNIVAMALRKEPARRYASVAQLAEDIRRHMEGLTVTARQDTLGYRAGKFVRRNKPGVAAGAFVVLALVGGLVTTTWQARVAQQERDHARLAQINAESAEKQAKRLNGFLQALLGSVNPENGTGRDLKVVQVLDKASTGVDRELAADPAILAQAHLTLGQAYTNLKEAEPAIRHLQAAVDIDRRLYGDDDIVTARAKLALGKALMTLQRRYVEAEPWLREALTVERRQPTAEQSDLPELLKYLGLTLSGTKHLEEASALASESLLLTRKTDGEQSVPFAKGLGQFGFIKMNEGDYAAAEEPFRQAVVIYRKVAPHTPSYANALSNLAYSLILQGKLDEPEDLLREVLECYRATVGEDNATYHLNLGLHGLLHFERKDYPTAETELRAGVTYLLPLVSKSDEDVAGGMVALGLTLTREGKADEGEPWLRESLDRAKTYNLEGMAAPRNVEAALGECLLAQKRYAEAEPLLLTNYDRLQTRAGGKGPKSVEAARRLYELYSEWNKPAEAARFASNGTTPPAPTQ